MIWTLLKTVIKARRNGLLHLVPSSEVVRLDCLADKCGRCCQTLGSPVVTPGEAEKMDSGVIEKDKHSMFIKSKKSTCCLLQKNLCSIYPDRPRGCREYPWYNIGGVLYYDNGCPGMKEDIDGRPDVESIQPFENFFPAASGWIIRMVRNICVENK